MSKYYVELEDVIQRLDNAIYCANRGEFDSYLEAMKRLRIANAETMPTIEVKGSDLEDAILLTKDAYSDLCLKASQVSDKAECDNCIWNVCNYNKIDWEVSEDCISRSTLISFIDAGHLRNPNEKCYSENDVVELIKNAPSVVPKPKEGEWILECDAEGEGDNLYRCSECGRNCGCQEYDLPNFCYHCGADMRGEEE